MIRGSIAITWFSVSVTVELSKSNTVQVTLPNLGKHLMLPQAQPHPPPSSSQPHLPSSNQPHPDSRRPVVPLTGLTGSNQDALSSAGQAQSIQDTKKSSLVSSDAKTIELLPSSQLTQPVPLGTLIQHNILQPGPRNLTCTILV